MFRISDPRHLLTWEIESQSSQQTHSTLPDAGAMDDEEDIDYIDPRLQRQATLKRKTVDTLLRSAKTNVCPATRRPAPP